MATNPQLALALRKNRGKQIRPDWIVRLKQACGYEVPSESFLSLETTETLKSDFLAQVRRHQASGRQYWLGGACDRFANCLNKLGLELGSKRLVLFSSVDEYLGAVELPAAVITSGFRAIWDVVEEDFCVTTADLKDGLCVELNFYDADGKYVQEGVWEVTCWGAFEEVVKAIEK